MRGVDIFTYRIFANNGYCHWSCFTNCRIYFEKNKKATFGGLTHSGRNMRWYLLAILYCSVFDWSIGYRARPKLMCL